MKKIDIKPMPPIDNEKACVLFLLILLTIHGSDKAYTADTAL